MGGTYTLFQLIAKGGISMIILLICSIFIIGIIIERWWYLKKINLNLDDILYRLQSYTLMGNTIEAINLCETVKTPIALIFKAGLLKAGHPPSVIEDALERAILEQIPILKKRIWFLGTMGGIAPFIGLFGTVIGIIKAFHSIALTGEGGLTVVSAGIAEALIATAGGLVVAIIAVISYNSFVVWVNNILHTMRTYAMRLLDFLVEKR